MPLVSDLTKNATAGYIKTMLGELRTKGQQIECDMLVYLLEMAMAEAADIEAGRASTGRTVSSPKGEATSTSAKHLATLYMTGQLDA